MNIKKYFSWKCRIKIPPIFFWVAARVTQEWQWYFKHVLKTSFWKTATEKKPYYLVGDVNINCWEYFENEKVSTFYNSLFEYGAIALINKPTRVAKKSATRIDNVITANIFNEPLKKGINKSDLSDHIPIFFSISTSKLQQNSSPLKLKKRFFNKRNLASFKN